MGRSDTAVKDGCPAFVLGCPYAADQNLLHVIKSRRYKDLGRCPAFSEGGCPFREIQHLTELREQLGKLPLSHSSAPTGSTKDTAEASPSLPSSVEISQKAAASVAPPVTGDGSEVAHTTLLEILHAVHQASQVTKEAVGSDCPVFLSCCPFKNCLTSGGTPLVLELEQRSWGLQTAVGSASTADSDDEVIFIDESSLSDVATNTLADVAAVEEECLARKLKLGTKESHDRAERVHFMRQFIKLQAPKMVYAQLVVNLCHVYKAMEEALDVNWEHEFIEPLYYPDELYRLKALKADAEFFYGPGWEERTEPSPVAKEYVLRLEEISRNSPELLVAHAYTRYLGDLSGGQLLKKCAQRAWDLPFDNSGVQFFIFKRVACIKKFKDMFRAQLDNLPADKACADRMVVEANHAFDLNTRMFSELDTLAGFDELPPPPPSEPAVLDAPNTESSISSATTPSSVLCPFATMGLPMPPDHPMVRSGPASSPPVSASAQRAPSPSGAGTTRPYPPWLGLLIIALIGIVLAAISSRVPLH